MCVYVKQENNNNIFETLKGLRTKCSITVCSKDLLPQPKFMKTKFQNQMFSKSDNSRYNNIFSSRQNNEEYHPY